MFHHFHNKDNEQKFLKRNLNLLCLSKYKSFCRFYLIKNYIGSRVLLSASYVHSTVIVMGEIQMNILSH